jgi:hypothetical protein
MISEILLQRCVARDGDLMRTGTSQNAVRGKIEHQIAAQLGSNPVFVSGKMKGQIESARLSV